MTDPIACLLLESHMSYEIHISMWSTLQISVHYTPIHPPDYHSRQFSSKLTDPRLDLLAPGSNSPLVFSRYHRGAQGKNMRGGPAPPFGTPTRLPPQNCHQNWAPRAKEEEVKAGDRFSRVWGSGGKHMLNMEVSIISPPKHTFSRHHPASSL